MIHGSWFELAEMLIAGLSYIPLTWSANACAAERLLLAWTSFRDNARNLGSDARISGAKLWSVSIQGPIELDFQRWVCKLLRKRALFAVVCLAVTAGLALH
jgi:hypothetical protein